MKKILAKNIETLVEFH